MTASVPRLTTVIVLKTDTSKEPTRAKPPAELRRDPVSTLVVPQASDITRRVEQTSAGVAASRRLDIASPVEQRPLGELRNARPVRDNDGASNARPRSEAVTHLHAAGAGVSASAASGGSGTASGSSGSAVALLVCAALAAMAQLACTLVRAPALARSISLVLVVERPG